MFLRGSSFSRDRVVALTRRLVLGLCRLMNLAIFVSTRDQVYRYRCLFTGTESLPVQGEPTRGQVRSHSRRDSAVLARRWWGGLRATRRRCGTNRGKAKCSTITLSSGPTRCQLQIASSSRHRQTITVAGSFLCGHESLCMTSYPHSPTTTSVMRACTTLLVVLPAAAATNTR